MSSVERTHTYNTDSSPSISGHEVRSGDQRHQQSSRFASLWRELTLRWQRLSQGSGEGSHLPDKLWYGVGLRFGIGVKFW